MTDATEYVRRSTLNMTNLKTAHKRKDRSRLYHIVGNDFATTAIGPNGNQAEGKIYYSNMIHIALAEVTLGSSEMFD